MENDPIQDMGIRWARESRTHIKVGGWHAITYVDRLGRETKWVIDVVRKGRKVMIASSS